MSRIKFLYGAASLASREPQFRGFMEVAIMERATNELIELGSVSTDTAGDVPPGIEQGGKFEVTGLRQD